MKHAKSDSMSNHPIVPAIVTANHITLTNTVRCMLRSNKALEAMPYIVGQFQCNGCEIFSQNLKYKFLENVLIANILNNLFSSAYSYSLLYLLA